MFAMALLEAVHLLFDPANGIKTEKCHFIHILDALESTFVFNVSLTFFFLRSSSANAPFYFVNGL